MLFPTLLSIASLLAASNASPVAEKRADNVNLGCYLPAAVLGVPFISLNGMTVEVCRSFCAFQQTTYAALTSGTSCTCSNVLTDITSLNLGCNAPCSGNPAETCGGYNTFQNVYLVAGAQPVSQSVAAGTTTTRAATTQNVQTTTTTRTSTTQTSTSTAAVPTTTTTSYTAQATSSSTSSTSARVTVSTTATSTSVSTSSSAAATTTSSSSTSTLTSTVAATSTTSAAATSAAVITPVQTAGPISGYTLTQSGLTAAANGNGYLSAYLTTDGYNTAQCAQSCTAISSCAFFNIYQQQSGSTFSDVCVLWQYVQSASEFNNYYNNGLPITYSAGYAKIIPSVSSSTTTAAQTTSTSAVTTTAAQTTSTAARTTSSAAQTTSAAPVTTGTCSDAATPAGYTAGFQCLTAAADGNGYLSSYIDSTATSYNQLVTDCAASCSLVSGCAFFNVYQENSRTTNICVLWNTVKDASTATNTYNNGVPVSNSNGYILSAPVASTTTSSAAPTATATACSNALAPGYAVCYNGQRVVNGACVN